MRECECGRPKGANAQACERCQYLDGGLLSDIIQELRAGACTVSQLAAATGRKRNSVHKNLLRLERRGRVAQLYDADQGESVERIYVLVDRQESAA